MLLIMDRRSSSPDVLTELRERAVSLKKAGKTHQEIAGILKIGHSTSRLYWKLYKSGGQAAIKLGKRGRPTGCGQKLNVRQQKTICQLITDHTPDQLKMPFALWTRQAVAELIGKKFGFKLPVRTLGEYLKRWGFTPQRPKRQDYSQQPDEVRQWLDTTYPEIKRRSEREGSVIYWGDETGVSNQDQAGRSYAPKGQTPVRRAFAKKVTSCMISAINNKGQVRFMLYRKAMTAELFVGFLKRLVRSSDKKVLLIVDNLRAHKAQKVLAWLKDNSHSITVHYLPSYSPELNPDEYLNNTLKKQLSKEPAVDCVNQQQTQIRRVMRSNQKKPALIASLFRAPAVRYAIS